MDRVHIFVPEDAVVHKVTCRPVRWGWGLADMASQDHLSAGSVGVGWSGYGITKARKGLIRAGPNLWGRLDFLFRVNLDLFEQCKYCREVVFQNNMS